MKNPKRNKVVSVLVVDPELALYPLEDVRGCVFCGRGKASTCQALCSGPSRTTVGGRVSLTAVGRTESCYLLDSV